MRRTTAAILGAVSTLAGAAAHAQNLNVGGKVQAGVTTPQDHLFKGSLTVKRGTAPAESGLALVGNNPSIGFNTTFDSALNAFKSVTSGRVTVLDLNPSNEYLRLFGGTAAAADQELVAGQQLVERVRIGLNGGSNYGNVLWLNHNQIQLVGSPYGQIYTPSPMWLTSDAAVLIKAGLAERMRVDTNGEVGIGTADPQYRLHVNASTVQDVMGIGWTDNTAYSQIAFVTDIGTGSIWKGGSTYATYGGPSSLNIYNNSPTAGQIARISFHPGYGTAIAQNGVQIVNNGSGGGKVCINCTTAVADASAHNLYVNGTAWVTGGTWSGSSREFKEGIRPVRASEYAVMLQTLVDLDASFYQYTAAHGGDGAQRLGFIAEELPADVLSPDGKGVDVYGLVTYAIGALKAMYGQVVELQQRLADQDRLLVATIERVKELEQSERDRVALAGRVKDLEQQNGRLEARLERLESLLAHGASTTPSAKR